MIQNGALSAQLKTDFCKTQSIKDSPSQKCKRWYNPITNLTWKSCNMVRVTLDIAWISHGSSQKIFQRIRKPS